MYKTEWKLDYQVLVDCREYIHIFLISLSQWSPVIKRSCGTCYLYTTQLSLSKIT